MGKLRRQANANNNSGIGKYDNHISGCTHKIFITGGMERERREQQKKGGRRRRGRRSDIKRQREREREMTAGIYQHGVDVFLVFLLEEDDDV